MLKYENLCSRTVPRVNEWKSERHPSKQRQTIFQFEDLIPLVEQDFKKANGEGS
jgi:hypothetical protein